MKLYRKCSNCGACVIYEKEDIKSEERYKQAKPRYEGQFIVFPANIFDKERVYIIACPQCNTDIVCGRETLEENVNIEGINILEQADKHKGVGTKTVFD